MRAGGGACLTLTICFILLFLVLFISFGLIHPKLTEKNVTFCYLLFFSSLYALYRFLYYLKYWNNVINYIRNAELNNNDNNNLMYICSINNYGYKLILININNQKVCIYGKEEDFILSNFRDNAYILNLYNNFPSFNYKHNSLIYLFDIFNFFNPHNKYIKFIFKKELFTLIVSLAYYYINFFLNLVFIYK